MRWVIGDVHGMLRPLRALLDVLRARDADARFLFVGDYVNRGPDTRGVIDLLISLQSDGVARFVRGNHDDVLDICLHDQSLGCHPDACNPVAAFTWFVNYGLDNTLTSYGVDLMDIEWARHHPTEPTIRRLFEPVPEPHRRFVRGLPAVVEDEDLFVVHAMWSPDETDDSPSIEARLADDPTLRHKALWGRFVAYEITRRNRWRRTGYFGHTPVETFPASLTRGANVPVRRPGIVLVDTGAALSAGGRLSAVCAESGEVVQVDRSGVELASSSSSAAAAVEGA